MIVRLMRRKRKRTPGYEFAAMPPRFIVNFPAKRRWRGKSRIEDIEAGLAALSHEIRERGIESIAIPALGSDLGKLNWEETQLGFGAGWDEETAF